MEKENLKMGQKCQSCGNQEFAHHEEIGRGKPPKGWVRKKGDRKLYSWKGIWDIYTCTKCGEDIKILRD